jgi:hypothetical protein
MGFTVATRDTTPFEAVGVAVVNPFDETDWPQPRTRALGQWRGGEV